MEQKERFSESKLKRIAVGATVAGVLLCVFLLAILIVQFVQMGVRIADNQRYSDLTEALKQEIESKEDLLDWYENSDGLYYEALHRGWTSAG